MVNQHHALIFNEKNGGTVIGVLVKDFFFFLIITWLRLRQHTYVRSFPLKNCHFEKVVKNEKKKSVVKQSLDNEW